MTAERSSEDNDGHQVRATIGLAGGCALQRALRAGIRGLSKGFIDFEALVAAAAGSRHCPRPPPLARLDPPPGRMACYSFAQAGYVRAEPAILQPAEPLLDLSGEDIRKSLNGVLRRELSRARQFDRSTSA
jgi:hypothetical protein